MKYGAVRKFSPRAVLYASMKLLRRPSRERIPRYYQNHGSVHTPRKNDRSNLRLPHVTAWSAPIGHVTFCRRERPWENNLTGKLHLNKQSRWPEIIYGRTFRLGKSLVKDMRSLLEEAGMFEQHSTREVLQP